MLFNSYGFLFAFLPLALAGFYVSSRVGRQPAAAWLIVASFFFYGWWNPVFVILLIESIAFNYAVSTLIRLTSSRRLVQSTFVVTGVAVNLGALVYYKYFESLLSFTGGLGLTSWRISPIELPLGISFFTFTQIGYLFDVQQGEARDTGLLNYILFVTFFPHLIAGPILHNREIMPQFGNNAVYRFSAENLVVGLSIFVIGLAKKCVFADSLAGVVAPGFQAADHLGLWSSWGVLLSYSLQLYYDFSGYSDMAIGIAWMFNIRFPVNFNSPQKAISIIDYWQRWHMTLTRYLALYLYNPIALSVTRRRAERGLPITSKAQATPGGFLSMVAVPTMLTMGVAGIWHGAGLQYLIFGLLHGSYLTINHAWRIFRRRTGKSRVDTRLQRWTGALLTFLAVLVALAFFRAPSVAAAVGLLGGLSGLHGVEAVSVPTAIVGMLGEFGRRLVAQTWMVGVSPTDFASSLAQWVWLAGLYGVVWCMPNSQEIMANFSPALTRVRSRPAPWLAWQPSLGWALGLGTAATVAVLAMGSTSEFLYFKF